jgi:hypothetical protein
MKPKTELKRLGGSGPEGRSRARRREGTHDKRWAKRLMQARPALKEAEQGYAFGVRCMRATWYRVKKRSPANHGARTNTAALPRRVDC